MLVNRNTKLYIALAAAIIIVVIGCGLALIEKPVYSDAYNLYDCTVLTVDGDDYSVIDDPTALPDNFQTLTLDIVSGNLAVGKWFTGVSGIIEYGDIALTATTNNGNCPVYHYIEGKYSCDVIILRCISYSSDSGYTATTAGEFIFVKDGSGTQPSHSQGKWDMFDGVQTFSYLSYSSSGYADNTDSSSQALSVIKTYGPVALIKLYLTYGGTTYETLLASVVGDQRYLAIGYHQVGFMMKWYPDEDYITSIYNNPLSGVSVTGYMSKGGKTCELDIMPVITGNVYIGSTYTVSASGIICNADTTYAMGMIAGNFITLPMAGSDVIGQIVPTDTGYHIDFSRSWYEGDALYEGQYSLLLSQNTRKIEGFALSSSSGTGFSSDILLKFKENRYNPLGVFVTDNITVSIADTIQNYQSSRIMSTIVISSIDDNGFLTGLYDNLPFIGTYDGTYIVGEVEGTKNETIVNITITTYGLTAYISTVKDLNPSVTTFKCLKLTNESTMEDVKKRSEQNLDKKLNSVKMKSFEREEKIGSVYISELAVEYQIKKSKTLADLSLFNLTDLATKENRILAGYYLSDSDVFVLFGNEKGRLVSYTFTVTKIDDNQNLGKLSTETIVDGVSKSIVYWMSSNGAEIALPSAIRLSGTYFGTQIDHVMSSGAVTYSSEQSSAYVPEQKGYFISYAIDGDIINLTTADLADKTVTFTSVYTSEIDGKTFYIHYTGFLPEDLNDIILHGVGVAEDGSVYCMMSIMHLKTQ